MTFRILFGALLVAVTVHAATDPVDKCVSSKIKATGQKTFSKAKCYQKAILTAFPVDQACLDEAETQVHFGDREG